mgnify:CR=1 FL=1
MTTEPTMASSATVYERGPGLLVRFVWWLFTGSPNLTLQIVCTYETHHHQLAR